MSFRYAGFPGVVFAERTREHDPRDGGWTTSERYKGIKAAINGLAQVLIADKIKFRVIEDTGPYATLEISADEALDGETDENKEADLNIIWDMPNNRLEKDLFTKPGIAGPSDDVVYVVEVLSQMLDRVRDFDSGVTAADYLDAPVSPFPTDIAREIFRLKVAGQESYQISQWVVRRKITLEERYSKKWSIINNNHQFTTDQLVTLYKAEENLKVELPDGAWLMQSTTFAQQGNGKVEVTEEWWHADYWPPLIYPARIEEEVVT